jgi:hypothetical protein
MSGFLGIGGNSAKTDRSNQLQATTDLTNVFGYGLGTGQNQESTGASTLSNAGDAFKSFLSSTAPGRTQTIASAAPAINAATAGADALKRQESTSGTGRTGGTAELNKEQGATTDATVDNIISNQLGLGQKLTQEKQIAGAQGLAGVGAAEESNAANLLGLGTNAETSILDNSTKSRELSQKINTQTAQGWGAGLGQLLSLGMGFFTGGGDEG